MTWYNKHTCTHTTMRGRKIVVHLNLKFILQSAIQLWLIGQMVECLLHCHSWHNKHRLVPEQGLWITQETLLCNQCSGTSNTD